jgi:hypothetical protein
LLVLPVLVFPVFVFPSVGVRRECSPELDWTRMVMTAPSSMARYPVSQPSPRIGMSAFITFSMTLFT